MNLPATRRNAQPPPPPGQRAARLFLAGWASGLLAYMALCAALAAYVGGK